MINKVIQYTFLYKYGFLVAGSSLYCYGTDNNCCLCKTQCARGDGDCDLDSQCAGDSECGNANCNPKTCKIVWFRGKRELTQIRFFAFSLSITAIFVFQNTPSALTVTMTAANKASVTMDQMVLFVS